MGSQKSKLSPATMQELISSTAFTEDEINTWFAGFRSDSPDGTINLEQFKKVYRSVQILKILGSLNLKIKNFGNLSEFIGK